MAQTAASRRNSRWILMILNIVTPTLFPMLIRAEAAKDENSDHPRKGNPLFGPSPVVSCANFAFERTPRALPLS